ncbi:hypothetical protein AD945_02925 [Gluconobacter albidus]|uniref:Uncharacterized protein n=1 Tax=Gluconobacter albidus TaxID=318683 RepID=A0A149TM50_9PROT|nr:hypothetical protein AD945_02925 [Gluconobacter albidus]
MCWVGAVVNSSHPEEFDIPGFRSVPRKRRTGCHCQIEFSLSPTVSNSNAMVHDNIKVQIRPCTAEPPQCFRKCFDSDFLRQPNPDWITSALFAKSCHDFFAK